MYEILRATYNNGNLILSKKLNAALEGKVLNIIILDTNELEQKKGRLLIDRQASVLPEDYHFNREELYDR